MVGPLVGHAQRHAGGDLAVVHVAEAVGVALARILLAFGQIVAQMQLLARLQLADRILGEHHHAQRADRLGNAVVDLGVDVVRTASQHDAAAVVFLHVRQGAQALLLHVVLEDLVLGVGGLDGLLRLLAGHVRPRELLHDALDHQLVVGQVEVRPHVADALFAQFGHIGADDHRIVGHHRAVVVVVGVVDQVLLVAHARVENRLHALAEQPLDVAVHQLGRVADVLGGDRLDARFEQFMAGTPGDHDLEAQRGEQREPERIVLIHVEHARDADLAAGGLLVGEPAVGEAPLVLVVVQVRPVGTLLLGVAAAFAAVAGHVARAVGECGDRQLAVVLAQLAHVTRAGHRQVVEFLALEDRGLGAVLIVHAGGERGAVRAHKPRDVRAGDLALGEQLECAQHGVVEERAALHDHRIAQFARVAQLDDLVQRVAHHRIAQARGDVLDRGAFLLRLLDRGVHEHGAARAQVHRMRGVQRGLRELLDGQAHRLREGLQERAAAGGAGLVDGDRVDDAVGDGQVLHVLAADVDDGGDAGADHFGAAVVRHRLDHALVQVQAGGDQALAVAGGAGACDPRTLGQFGLDALDDVDGRGQRAAVVRGVAGPDNLTVVVDQRGLDGGRSGIDAQEMRAGRVLQRADVHVLTVVPGVEGLAVRFGREQRGHRRGVDRQVFEFVQTRQDVGAGAGLEVFDGVELLRLPGQQSRAERHVQMGVGRHDEFVDLAFERPMERLAQLGHEEQRAAQEDDGAVDRTAGRQTGDGLGGDGGEDGGRQIRLGGAVVDQRLQVGFGEHAAAGCDRIQRGVVLGHLVEAFGVGVQQRGHLVDERAGTARAGAVHTLLRRRLEISDLGVLAAQLDDDVGLRVFGVDRLGLGDDLLDERYVQAVGERQTAGTGDGQPNRLVTATLPHQCGVDVLQQSGHGGAHIGVMTAIVGEQHAFERILLIEHHGLHRGRADVESYAQRLHIAPLGRGIRGIHHVHLVRFSAGTVSPGTPHTPGYPYVI